VIFLLHTELKKANFRLPNQKDMLRKNFLQLTTMSLGSLMVPGLLQAHPAQQDPVKKALASIAMSTARAKGASYADVRISGHAQQSAGIRVFVNGKWGFASTESLTTESIVQCTEAALASASGASASAKRHQYDLKEQHQWWSCS
jgi:TldD protein